ncbi:hypothetical protein [Sphingobium aquiterrae]|uniref:hypothetical protein n=1 Tax=Sphingobium aquiterrae TaxID=2038656 RepID=UPI0030197C4A
MATLSIGKAWEDSIAFVRREWQLLFPVAFLFVALPVAILQQMVPPEMAQWAMAPQGDPPMLPPSFWLAVALTSLITSFGSLALYALALLPGISVAEALQLGVRRFGTLVLIMLVFMGALLALTIALTLLFVGLGFLSKAVAAVLAILLGLAIMVLGVLAGVRMILLNPVLIDTALGPVDAIRRSWTLARGHFWRLFGFILVIAIFSFVVTQAAAAVFGSIAGLLGGATAAQAVGELASIIISTVVQVYFLVMLARIYRQLDAA